MAAPKGYLMIPIGENPSGDLRSLTVDANDYLQIALSDLGGSSGMGEPKGLLITPVAYNPDGDLRSLELDASDYLLVTVLGGSDDDVLTSDGTKGAWEALGSVLKSALLTANGDMIVRNSSGDVVRLPAGLANEILGIGAGIPTWEAGSKKTLTTLGDVLFASAANALARLGIGSNGKVLTVVGGAPAWAAATGGYTEGARAYNSALITIGTSSWTPITCDSERYDTDTIHDTGSNTERLTAITAGKYVITGHVIFEADATGLRLVRILLNGATPIAFESMVPIGASSDSRGVATIYDLAEDDYVELQVYQNSGGDLDILQVAARSPEFAMQRIG